jgi:hypothetical protein
LAALLSFGKNERGAAFRAAEITLDSWLFECWRSPLTRFHPALAENVYKPLILLKNTVLLAQKVDYRTRRKRLSYQALRVCCGAGNILASLRRFP